MIEYDYYLRLFDLLEFTDIFDLDILSIDDKLDSILNNMDIYSIMETLHNNTSKYVTMNRYKYDTNHTSIYKAIHMYSKYAELVKTYKL